MSSSGTGAAASMIEADGVEKRFGGPDGLLALDRLDLRVPAGEFVSLLGPSGCGKSTFLRCVAGLEHPTRGEIRVAGRPVREPPEDLGMAFQRDALLDWISVLDNVLLPADLGRHRRRDLEGRARELLRMVKLEGFADVYPTQLSGGMRQRVAICRSLLLHPRLLLMDEPFGALDALTRDQLNLDLHRLWRGSGMTVLFVTHSITEAVFLSTRIIVLAPRPGRVVADIAVDLPEERHLSVRDEPAFIGYGRQIRQLFADMGLLEDQGA